MEIRRIAYCCHAKTLCLLLFCFKQKGGEENTHSVLFFHFLSKEVVNELDC